MSGEVKGKEERRDTWGWRVCEQEGMGGGYARPRLRYMGTSSAGGEEGWHGQECFSEVTVRRTRREVHEVRIGKERGVWREEQEAPREGRACADRLEALQDWHEVCFAIALNAVNILVLCLSVNIQFSLIHVLLWVTGSLAEFYVSYY